LGLRRSGESVDRQTIEIVRVENGKAVEHWGARS
jgi:predicted SnoaL-like aldol condensation-catalyzing enzyme